MELTGLEAILSSESGNKFCPFCGTPFKPYNSRQITCGAPECKRLQHNQYMKERTKRLREEDIELWRKYHREATAKSRAKKKKLIERDAQLKDIAERWKRQFDLDKKVSEYGINYGEIQKRKTLDTVPKIDVNLGGTKHDNVHDKDSRE